MHFLSLFLLFFATILQFVEILPTNSTKWVYVFTKSSLQQQFFETMCVVRLTDLLKLVLKEKLAH